MSSNERRPLWIAMCFFMVLPWGDAAYGQGVSWGVRVGMTYHGHTFEDPLPWWDASNQFFPSLMATVEAPMHFVEGPLGEILTFSTGLRYARLASKVDWQFEVESTGQLFTGAFSIRQHYLSIPIQLKLRLGRLPVYLLAGPEMGVLLFARKKSETFEPAEFASLQTEGVGGDIKRLHASLHGGFGVATPRNAWVYIKYGQGMRGMKKGPDRPVLDTDWQAWEAEIGIQLPIFSTN